MKSTMAILACIMFANVVLTSCKKTSRNEMSEQWRVMSYENSLVVADETGTQSHFLIADAENVSDENFWVNLPSGDSTIDNMYGTVTEHNFTIAKDGTWSRSFKYNLTKENAGETYYYTFDILTSGTWSFLSDVGEFEKNSRISFSTLSETEVQNTKQYLDGALQLNQSYTNTDSYVENETVTVFVVVEVKGKKLELLSDGLYTSNYSNFSLNYSCAVTTKISYVLEKK